MPKRKASTSRPFNGEEQTEIETAVIVPNGDLYMVLRTNINETKRLLVSRYILCLSSKVFDAMIGDNGRFQEATDPKLSSDGRRQVTLEDEDFLAMSAIMNILHLQHDRVPPHISFTQLHETAMICHKYDLTRSLGLWPAMWAQHYVDRIEKKGFHAWLLVASVFKQKEAFTKITRHLILNSKFDGDTEELVTEDGWPFTEGVSGIIIDKMENARATTIFKLQDCLWQRFDRLQSSDKKRRLCSQYDDRKVERSDLERGQCDTWNLGCLAQFFPNTMDPRDDEEHHDVTISRIINKVEAMDDFQNDSGYILSKSYVRSHIRGTSCGYLPSRMRNHVARVEGLRIEDC